MRLSEMTDPKTHRRMKLKQALSTIYGGRANAILPRGSMVKQDQNPESPESPVTGERLLDGGTTNKKRYRQFFRMGNDGQQPGALRY